MKPFAPACERNRDSILQVLKRHLPAHGDLLEIGSGTGQHAVYLQPKFPDWIWQCSDVTVNLPGIQSWLLEAANPCLPAAISFDVNQAAWPTERYSAVFTANTLHIMSWASVQALFSRVRELLKPQGLLMIYGPFNYKGAYTSPSNAQFDEWLKARDAQSAIRDFEAVNGLAAYQGLSLLADHEMPANNRMLVWRVSD